MARPSWNGRGYTADLKIYRRRQSKRVPKRFWGHLEGTDRDQAAQGWCDEVERYCRLLEGGKFRPSDVRHAVDIGAISEAEGQALNAGEPPPVVEAVRSLCNPMMTIEAAAEAHPVTVREKDSSPKSYQRHAGELQDFLKFSGLVLLRDLRWSHLESWVKHYKTKQKPMSAADIRRATKLGREPAGKPYSHDHIRHSLYHVKRAIAMAGAYDIKLPMPAKGERIPLGLPKKSKAKPYWSLEQMGRGIRHWLAKPDADADKYRMLVIIGLGGFMGLRPSEIIDVCKADTANGALRCRFEDVVENEGKNAWSQRMVPIPPTLYGWIANLTANLKPEDRILHTVTKNGRYRNDFDMEHLCNWFRPRARQAIGEKMTPKSLRKGFTTWVRSAGCIATKHMEDYMGHAYTEGAASSRNNYMQRSRFEELIPASRVIDHVMMLLVKDVPMDDWPDALVPAEIRAMRQVDEYEELRKASPHTLSLHKSQQVAVTALKGAS